ncbi:hypothetical protein [Spirosoma koreense]
MKYLIFSLLLLWLVPIVFSRIQSQTLEQQTGTFTFTVQSQSDFADVTGASFTIETGEDSLLTSLLRFSMIR